MTVLRRGSRGPEVVQLQEALHVVGTLPRSEPADGIFGSATEQAVRAWQRTAGLVVDGVAGPATIESLEDAVAGGQPANIPRPLPIALQVMEAAGHQVYWRGDGHLTIFGVRSSTREANRFDDLLGVAYTVDGRWVVETFAATTDPGTYWLRNPSRVAGTAILVPGQYRDTWKIDLHGGKYRALCQRSGPVKVYRDGDRDDMIDMDPSSIAEGYFGINIHRSSASGESTQVDKWSAGCQVFARTAGFDRMMELADEQIRKTGIDTFTYTLLSEPLPPASGADAG